VFCRRIGQYVCKTIWKIFFIVFCRRIGQYVCKTLIKIFIWFCRRIGQYVCKTIVKIFISVLQTYWPIRLQNTNKNFHLVLQTYWPIRLQNYSEMLPNLLNITMWIRWLWLGRIGEYGPRPSKLGYNTTLRPTAVGWYCTPISQDIGPYSPIRPHQSQRILSFCTENGVFPL